MTISTASRHLGRIVCCGVLAALLLVTQTRADPASARAAVRVAMDDMEKAVLAGDQAAYLAHVATDDPNFATEQKNWAKDLGKFVPVEFSLAFEDEDKDAAFSDDEARFTLVMSWKMPEDMAGGGGGINRKIKYPVLFRRENDKWLYRGEDWTILEAPGVGTGGGARVKFFPGHERAAQAIIDALPEIRAHVDEGFELKIDRVQEVKIYKSMRHLQASIYLSYVDQLGGWNEPKESIKVLSNAVGGKGGARIVLAHEYGHVCTFEYGPHTSDMPWWVLEGAAELAAEYYAHDADGVDAQNQKWAKAGMLARWEDMADFRSCPDRLQWNVYKQGQHMLGYISEHWKRQGRNAWLKSMAQGKTIDQATQEVMGMPFADLDKQWRESLGAVEARVIEPAGDAPETKKPGKPLP
jgi:hypothetical protein